MDLNEEIRQLQDIAGERQRAKVRAQMDREAAQAAVARAEAKLSGLGVSTVEEAKALLATMEEELRDAVAAVRLTLDESVTA